MGGISKDSTFFPMTLFYDDNSSGALDQDSKPSFIEAQAQTTPLFSSQDPMKLRDNFPQQKGNY